jgi:pimeloyl-ACP methyl ester carboxylesterase
MLQTFKNGQGSIVLRVKLLDSSSTTGAGLTGLTSASASLIISTIADNEATATAYTQAGSTIESITTLGTFAAPTATKCRFKEVDATNHKGVYEFQFADARFAVASAKSLLVSVAGATNLQQADFVVQLQTDDPFVAKLTAAQIATGIWQDTTAGDFTTALSVGKSVMNGVSLGTGLTVNALTTNNDKTGYALSSAGVQAIWDALTSALTTVGSIGKLIVDNLNATITSRMATYTQPTGFLAATFPGTVASPTNITAASGVALTAAYDLAKTAAQAGDAMALTAGERNSTADAFLNRDMSTGTDSGSTTVRTVRQALRFLRNKWSIAAGTLTVTKEDDVTASWTAAITTTAGDPVSASDPAGP